MSSERTVISFENECAADSLEARVGGAALLPQDTPWPRNPDGQELILLMSLPADYFGRNGVDIALNGQVISVFTTYDPDDWFLDCVTYHDDEDGANILNGYTQVLVHDVGSSRADAKLTLPPRRIATCERDEDTGCWLGGLPNFLQAQRLSLIEGKTFAMQLYSGSFPEGFEDVLGLPDAAGYLFLGGQQSIFFSQCT